MLHYWIKAVPCPSSSRVWAKKAVEHNLLDGIPCWISRYFFDLFWSCAAEKRPIESIEYLGQQRLSYTQGLHGVTCFQVRSIFKEFCSNWVAMNQRHGRFGSVLHEFDWFWTHLWINAGPKRDEQWWACTGNLALSEEQSTDSHWQLRTTGNTEWPLPTGTPLAIALTLRVASCLLATKRLGFPGFAQWHGDRFYFHFFFFGGGVPDSQQNQETKCAKG